MLIHYPEALVVKKILVAKEVDGDEVTVITVLPLRIDGNTLSNPYFQENTGQIHDEYVHFTLISSFVYDVMRSLHNGNLYRARSSNISWRANTNNVIIKSLICNVEIEGHKYSDGIYDSPYGESCLIQSDCLETSPNEIAYPAQNTNFGNAKAIPSMGYWMKFTDYSGGHGIFTYRAVVFEINGVEDMYDYGKCIIQ